MEYASFVHRLNPRLDELKWLYCELYQNDLRAFDYFVDMLRRSCDDRKPALCEQDEAHGHAHDHAHGEGH